MKHSTKRILSLIMAVAVVFTTVFSNVSASAFAGEVTYSVAEWCYTTANALTLADSSTLNAEATDGNGLLTISGPTKLTGSSNGISAAGWAVGNYWMMDIDATNFTDMKFSAKMKSSKTGPANFQLQYSADGGDTWTNIGEPVSLSTTWAKKYNAVALPEALNQKSYKLRLLVPEGTTISNNAGTSALNEIVITGTPVGEYKQVCKPVTALESGEVEAGTKIQLSCVSGNAKIYYALNGSENYSVYSAPIEINETTTISAYATKENYENSTISTFTYTVKAVSTETESTETESTETESTETESETETPVTEAELLDRALVDGDQVYCYFPASKVVLSSVANGKKLNGVEATVAENKLTIPEGVELLTVEENANGELYLKASDGKYLTSGSTGSALTFEATASAYSLWLTEDNEDGTYKLKNVNAKYGSSNQYLEYYNGFTTFSYKDKSSSAYAFSFYYVKKGVKKLRYDKDCVSTIAQWAGNANYDEAGITTVIKGDMDSTNDMLDSNAEYTAVVSGKNSKPYTSATSNTGSTSYYMGGTGLGAGTDDYMQFAFSSKGYANMNMSFRLRSSNTGAGSFQLQYSTDGETFTNFTTGTYAYAYTTYKKDADGVSVPSDVKGEGAITDGVAKTSLAPTYYVTFNFEIPTEAANSDKLYVRMVAGKQNAKGSAATSSSGVVRVDSVVVSGSPVVDDAICGYVKSDVPSGEVALNTELTLTSSTKDATIMYSINGADFKAYDEANKPVLSELPAKVVAYATKEGIDNSIKLNYNYTQAKCAAVKGTPNGGAVVENTRVMLKTTTEAATIMYAFVEEDVEDANLDWQEYTSPIVLKELPVDIKIKATKEGYLDSTVSTLKFTKKSNEKFNIYFGQIHAHTNYSDGSGSCEEAFQYASKVDNLDYIAITDHSNSLDNAADSKISENVDKTETDEWTAGHNLAKKYTTDDFTCVYGYEMTWSNGLGHMNTFNTPGFQSRTQTAYATYSTALQNYYAALRTVSDSISQFNHPGTTFGDFSDFSYYTEENDNLITMIEVGNGEGTIGSSGYFPSYEYYTRALDKGWHVAPTNNQDNHKGKWGDANTARTVMLADTNDEDAIYDAMRNYRIYATEDNNLSVYYTLDNNIMGTILEQDAVGDKVEIIADIKDADSTDKIGKVEVIVNGGLSVASKTVETNAETVKFEIPSNYSYYYVKITEADGDIAVTAPVWVGNVEACGINSTYTNTALAVQGESLDLNVDVYNNEKTDLTINNITITATDAEGLTTEICNVTGEEAKLSTVASNSTGTFKFDYTYPAAGKVIYEFTVNATLNGVEKTYNDKLTLNYTIPQMVTKVIVDGTHYNDYVAGYYGGNVTSFVNICADKSIKTVIETKEITAEDLKDTSLLVLAAPAKKNGTANAGDYKISHYSDEFLAMVKEYVANGGSVIICGLADYSDTTDCQTATEQNKLLETIGATIRMNSDEVYDEVNNGGQPFRLYPTNFNMDSKYLAGVVEGQTYSQYSGCSVDVSNAVENDVVYAGESLVRGFDTTYTIDCKDLGESAGNKANDNKGDITFIAHQATKAGGNIFVAGGVFMSDFEVKAEIDNNDSLPYANANIIKNILDEVKVELPVSTIAEARAGETGDVFAVEGYVTSGTANEFTTFFDTIYIQDETAGIDIFPYAAAGLEVGTKVRVVGYVSSYQGDKELKVIETKILDDEPYFWEAKELSTKDAMDYETYGGSLLKTTGIVTRVEYTSDGQGVSEFWIKDSSDSEAAIFIDGYIYSGRTGKNELASFVKVGAKVSAKGILYMHPEGDSDESVPVFRVRDCEDIVLVKDSTNPTDPTNPTDSTESTETESTESQTTESQTTEKPSETSTEEKKDEKKNETPQNQQTAEKKDNEITGVEEEYKLSLKAKAFTLAPSANGAAIKFTASDSEVVTVDENGLVTLVGTGLATITITAVENDTYKEATKTVTVKVVPAKASVKKFSNVKKSRLTLRWKTLTGVDGYQIQISSSKKFSSKTTITLKAKSTKNSLTIKNLKSGKKYYVRVRGYKKVTIDNKSKKLYGSWSNVRTVKTQSKKAKKAKKK